MPMLEECADIARPRPKGCGFTWTTPTTVSAWTHESQPFRMTSTLSRFVAGESNLMEDLELEKG